MEVISEGELIKNIVEKAINEISEELYYYKFAKCEKLCRQLTKESLKGKGRTQIVVCHGS